MSNKKLIFISIVTGIIIITSSVFFSNMNNSVVKPVPIQKQKTTAVFEAPESIGEIDSSHDHASIIMFINGESFNFSKEKYMLRNEFVHFEDGSGVVIHKHATSVTLPYFFSTLNIDLTKSCITFDTGIQYCSSPDGGKMLRVIVNGKEVEDVSKYKPQHKDKILINYGDDDSAELQFKFNTVPDIPQKLL